MSELTLEKLNAAYPELVKQIESAAYEKGFAQGRQEGVDTGMKAGAEKERERIKAVEANSLPGHEDLIASLKYDGVTTGEQAAVKVLAAEKALITVKKDVYLTEHTKTVEAAEASDDEAKRAEAQGKQEGPLTEEQMKAAWENSASLRAEFAGNFESYKAYTIAEQDGLVKIFQGKGGK